MIQTLILYFLSLKSTHGYEIQKFIQLNEFDRWTKIQSGSIYYALGKLEASGSISLASVDGEGAKARKVYAITERGRMELKKSVEEELAKEIADAGSDKFLIPALLGALDRDSIRETIGSHIGRLRARRAYLEKWQALKAGDHALKIEALSFEMMISGIDFQIRWHELLLEDLDSCVARGTELSRYIRAVDFSSLTDTSETFAAAMGKGERA